jgi:hypothetical protein
MVIRSVHCGIAADDMERRWAVFVGDGVISDCSWGFWVAANSAGTIDDGADLLQVSWQELC